jgi:hypothetical protein
MRKNGINQQGVAVRASSLVESLEDRRLLSAAPFQLKPVAPTKILAGNTASETVVIHNLTASAVTEAVNITLAPSLNGSTPAGAYSTPGVSETITLKAHGSATVKVPFVPPTTLTSGKYHTLATVAIGDAAPTTLLAPGTYTLTVPPAVTTTPSLVGTYKGIIKQTIAGSGKSYTHEAGFIWDDTAQTPGSLTGTFTVGTATDSGTMTGSENTTGAVTFTFTASDMTYTVVGKVSADGSSIIGTIKGTFVNNLWARLNGKFTLAREA